MKDFWRSLRYLKPYRGWIAVSLICVVLIGVLWGGGLGMVLPGSKILLSQEGLHGWAYNQLTNDRLGVRVVQLLVQAGTEVEGESISLVLEVTRTDSDGPAEQAGIHTGEWILGIADGTEEHRLMRGDETAKLLGNLPVDEPVTLRVYNPHERQLREVTVETSPAGATSRLLGRVADIVPEPATRPERYPLLLGLLGVGLVLTILRDILRFLQEYMVGRAVMRAMMDIRHDNFDVVLRLPMTHFSREGVTDTMSRFVRDTSEIAGGQMTLFGKTMVEPTKALASVVLAFMISWKLTLLALIAGPPAAWLIRKFGKRMKRASKRALESWSSLLGVLQETLRGMRVVKAYTMEGRQRRLFFESNRRLTRQQQKMLKVDAATSPAVEALGVTAAMGAAALAGYWVFNYDMSADDFLTLMVLLAAMFDPLRKLAKVTNRFQRSDAAATRVFSLMDREQERSVAGATYLPRHSESLQFEDVSFRYPSASADALRDVNLQIRAGETIAVVGPNGSGKTTLVSLVPRLIDPTHGVVRIDGRDISQYSVRSVRRQVGLVTQDTVLFNTTAWENIACGLRRPKPDDVTAAAKFAYVDEFARELPDGYDTILGEEGATLSGGQRQRISIARAILRDPSILIFDEATSQIDADSEHRIHQAMGRFIKGRTTLMIAHRFATVMSADRIVVMDAGRILDVGTHKELLERCDLYHHLYTTQFMDTEG
ncbi:MAG: ABC transporter transmembrane domain-containing protein [Phycisphaerae bacterium]